MRSSADDRGLGSATNSATLAVRFDLAACCRCVRRHRRGSRQSRREGANGPALNLLVQALIDSLLVPAEEKTVSKLTRRERGGDLSTMFGGMDRLFDEWMWSWPLRRPFGLGGDGRARS